VATRCKFRGRRGILCDVLKIDGSLARNIDFEVANFQVLRKTRRKTSILKLQSVKIGGSLARNPCFGAPTCLVWSLWFSCGFAVSMGEAAKPLLVACFRPCENLRKSRAKCWSRLESMGEAAKPLLLEVSKQVATSFCVAGVALCGIPTCLITCRKCQNWRKFRTKCSCCCAHVSRLESLVFLWARRVYGGSCKTSPYRRFASRLSCRLAWQAWHFVIFQPV